MLKKSPDSLVIVSAILLLFVLLTWIVPAGEFDRAEVNGRMVVVAGTYHKVDAEPQGFWALFRAPLRGFESAADIIGFVLLVGGAFLASWLLTPKIHTKAKNETYECGIETTGSSWVQFKVGYYLFAMLFLIFDVETIFIVPWAVVMKDVGMVAFIEILIFFLILGLGLLYAWKKRALQWE